MIPSFFLAFLPIVFAKDHIQRSHGSNKHVNNARTLQGGFEISHDMIQERLNSYANSTDLEKRGNSGRATFYDVGLGACGEYNSDSEFVVALNEGQYGSTSSVSKYCFKWINIQYGGKSAKAQVVDCCPGCPWGALDMSPSLFSHFADQDMGVFYMTWALVGESSGGETTTSKKSSTSYWQAPTTSSKKSTSYWQAPTTTSSWQASTTSYQSSSSVSSSYGSNSTNATISASGSANATATTSLNATSTGLASLPAEDFDYEGGVLYAVNQIVLGFTGLSGAILQEKGSAVSN